MTERCHIKQDLAHTSATTFQYNSDDLCNGPHEPHHRLHYVIIVARSLTNWSVHCLIKWPSLPTPMRVSLAWAQ